MRGKILQKIELFFSLLIVGLVFSPLDFLYVLLCELALCGIAFPLLLVNFVRCRGRQRLVMALLACCQVIPAIIFGFLFFDYSTPSIYHFMWKINFFCFVVPIVLLVFYKLRSQGNRRALSIACAGIMSIILVKTVFFMNHYIFGSKDLSTTIEFRDIRDYREEGYWKVVGAYKVLKKEPEKLEEVDLASMEWLLTKTDWLPRHYPEESSKIGVRLDKHFIQKNARYEFSLVDFYVFKRADIYILRIPLIQGNTMINVYIPKGTFYYLSDYPMNIYFDRQPEPVEGGLFYGLYTPCFHQWFYEEHIER